MMHFCHVFYKLSPACGLPLGAWANTVHTSVPTTPASSQALPPFSGIYRLGRPWIQHHSCSASLFISSGPPASRKGRPIRLCLCISQAISGVSKPKFTIFGLAREELRLITSFTSCRYFYRV